MGLDPRLLINREPAWSKSVAQRPMRDGTVQHLLEVAVTLISDQMIVTLANAIGAAIVPQVVEKTAARVMELLDERRKPAQSRKGHR